MIRFYPAGVDPAATAGFVQCFPKGTSGAGAYDLYMPEDGYIEDFAGPKVVKLGFAAAVPEGYVALLLPRSSTGFKFGVELNNTCGVIDSDFRGEWLASIINPAIK